MATINATDEQIKALEGFKNVIRSAAGRRDFATAHNKEAVFNRRRKEPAADYQQIPEKVRALLESLSDSELALLADLDDAFVRAGLSVEANPVPLMIH
jgi:hypothetical protein